MTRVFGDTFYWIALTLPTDAAHGLVQEIDCDIVTTDEVLTEYLTFFSRASQFMREQAASNVTSILNDPTVRVVPQSHESFLGGLALFQNRADKGYSQTDCVSMQVMLREGITAVLTNDKHFEQEGFKALFRDR